MSRIRVKGYANDINENKLRNIFGSKGRITDIQKFRNFCFISYSSKEEAKAAITYFNNAILDTSPLIVESCVALGIVDKPQYFKKVTKDDIINLDKLKAEDKTEPVKQEKKNPKVDESPCKQMNDDSGFEESFQESNDQDEEQVNSDEETKADEGKLKKLLKTRTVDLTDDWHVDCPEERKVTEELALEVPQDWSKSLHEELLEELTCERTEEPEDVTEECSKSLHEELLEDWQDDLAEEMTEEQPVDHRELSDEMPTELFDKVLEEEHKSLPERDYDDEKMEDQTIGEIESMESLSKSKPEANKMTDKRNPKFFSLKIQNILKTTKRIDVIKFFRPLKPYSVRLARKEDGFCYVRFKTERDMFKGKDMIKTFLKGKQAFLSNSNSKKKKVTKMAAGPSLKPQKMIKLQQDTQKPIGWNMLFLGGNAVAKLLGENQTVIEMKRFLEQQDVRLSAFGECNQKRSSTVLLARNLPSGTIVSDISSIFGQFGKIRRFVLPPGGVTAIIEFRESSVAQRAFQWLTHGKCKHVWRYLEWAPANIFKDVAIPVETELQPNDEDDEAEPNATIFIRNLNHKTVVETVRAHFEHLGTLHSVKIVSRKDPQNPGQSKSLGYGYIQFKKAAVASLALKVMQLTRIDGKPVKLARSEHVLQSQDEGAIQCQVTQKKHTGTKILVDNIPFQANDREVRNIFKIYGKLKSIDIPRMRNELTGEVERRGLASVVFANRKDAKRAFDALSTNTPLYGRTLMLQWANK